MADLTNRARVKAAQAAAERAAKTKRDYEAAREAFITKAKARLREVLELDGGIGDNVKVVDLREHDWERPKLALKCTIDGLRFKVQRPRFSYNHCYRAPSDDKLEVSVCVRQERGALRLAGRTVTRKVDTWATVDNLASLGAVLTPPTEAI